MLSFMREQEDLPVPANSQADSGNAAQQGGGDQNDDGYLTVSVQEKDVRRSTIQICIFLVIGICSLVFMIKKSAPTSAQAASTASQEQANLAMERAIAQLTGVRSEMSNSLEKIMNRFQEFSSLRQVALNGLAKNPFSFRSFSGNLGGRGGVGSDPVVQNGRMQLFSIMMPGSADARPCCMIDDKILYVGEMIGSFKVLEISDNIVKLKSENEEMVLRLRESVF